MIVHNFDIIKRRKLKDYEVKLQVLRGRLQASENSPLVVDFNAKTFIESLHKKYLK